MRATILVTITAIFCVLTQAQAQVVTGETRATARTPEDAAKMVGSPRFLYHQQVHTMLQAAVAPEFTRYHERLKGGSVKYAFQLDSRGHVLSVTTHSTKGSRWGEETLTRFIRSLKFPSVPPEAMKQEREEGHKFIEITGDMGWSPH